jgi:glutathione S-transferase
MDFYYGRISGNSARVAFGLYEAGVEFVPHPLDTRGGENKSLDYLAVNPMGKVPALKDGAFTLWESNAINLYVAEKQGRLIPGSPEGRASMMRWLFFQAAHVTPACVQFFRGNTPRVRDFYGTMPDPVATEGARKELSRYLPVLEAALSGRDFLEVEFTLADVAYASHLWLVQEGGLDFAPWPRVSAWLGRILARPAWQRAQALIF